MVAILISLVIWALIFWLITWAIAYIGVQEPFNKVLRVIVAVGAIIVIIGLLTGKIEPFHLAL